MNGFSMKERIERKLANSLIAPGKAEWISVEDVSHLHEGHAGWRAGGETHFRVSATSPLFEGKSRVERHRIVHGILAEELRDGIHALELNLTT